MDTVLIQLTNHNALNLLQELEKLHLIKVLKENIAPRPKLSARFAGKLKMSDEEYNKFQQYISDSRNEWDNHNI